MKFHWETNSQLYAESGFISLRKSQHILFKEEYHSSQINNTPFMKDMIISEDFVQRRGLITLWYSITVL